MIATPTREGNARAAKVCLVVFRIIERGVELLAFSHPSAGKQFVKGTIEPGEAASQAAVRELHEESGIVIDRELLELGCAPIGEQAIVWHFFAVKTDGLVEAWDHRARDDFGHTFSFFWHPLADDLDGDWHPQFHEALDYIRKSLTA